MTQIICTDETTSGHREAALVLELESERVTVRELIRRRVFQEVAEFHAKEAVGGAHGLVRPTEPESVPGGSHGPLHGQRRLDPERQFEAAVTAFERNGLLLLAGERQLTDLDEELELTPGLEITFLKLVPLVGG